MESAKTLQHQPLVLCVDDEPRVLDGLRLTLRRRYAVLAETDPFAALAVIESSIAIVAVISDMRMPGMDGATFLRKVAAMRPNIARILLSGETGCVARFAVPTDINAYCVLAKPCTPEQLITVMQAAIRQHAGVEL